jgi:hypothetical protein
MSYVDKKQNAEYARNWYQANKERLKADPERRVRNARLAAEWRDKHPERAMLSAAKARAKRLGFDFNIDITDIIIPDICPVLNIPVFFSKGAQTDNTPALDRIDNNKGYIKGNVCVISHKANRHKADLTFEDIKRLFRYCTLS